MPFGNITLSAVRYDNEPAVRSLSAIVIGGTPSSDETIKWSFDTSSVTARLPSGTSYIAETLGAVTSLSSIIFSITTDNYDYKSLLPTEVRQSIILGVTLLTGVEDIQENIGSSDTYELTFDLFPDIPPPTLYINYENTDNSDIFYRQATGTYNARLSVVFDDSFLNLTNFLTGSEEFANTNVWSTGSSLSASLPNQIVTPDNKTRGTLLIPSSGIPFNTISTITNVTTAGLPNYFLHTNQTYVVTQSGYTTTGSGVSAIFTITVSNSTVSTLSTTNGGLYFQPQDGITISRETLGLSVDDPTITFEIESVSNLDHFIARDIGPLTPQTYTYSVFAYPSGGGYLYFDGFNKGSAVFDVQDGIAYNNGTWDSVSIETYVPPPIDGTSPLFNVRLNGQLNTIVLSGDRFFLGGNFTTCNDVNVGYACAVDIDGNGPLTSGLTLSGFSSTVKTIAVSGNSLYVGGEFLSYRGTPATYLVCLTGSGDLASSSRFTGVPNAGVSTIVPNITSNIIFVGGAFTTYTGTSRRGLAVINPNGTLVSPGVFNFGTIAPIGASTDDVGANGVVNAIAFEPAGTILIGGSFRNWRGASNTKNIVRTSSTGAIQTTLNLKPGVWDETVSGVKKYGYVSSIQVDSIGNIYIGGSFENYNSTGTRNLVKLSSDGTTVNTFTVGDAGNFINNLTLNSSETSLYVGGNFTSVGGSSYYRLYRLDTTTNNIDSTFNTQLGFNNSVNTIFLSSGATKEGDVIFVGGNFTTYKGQVANNIISLNSSGNYRQSNFTLDAARGWSRCCATFTLTSTETDKLYLGVTTDTGSVSSDATSEDTVYVWGAQLNYLQTSTTTPYICTLSVPRALYYNTAHLYLNNQTTPTLYLPITASTIFTTLCSFDTSTPRVSSYQVVVSASSTFDSLGETVGQKWYTPHTYSNSISAIFVNTLLSADFVAFAKNYFNSVGSKVGPVLADSSSYTLTPGPCFYGEGHTETINLSANGTGALAYYWTIGSTDLGFYQASSITSISPSPSGYYDVSIPTQLNFYPKIPIQLVVSDGTILSSGPLYYYDDSTGEELPYPFYYNTEDLASRNTKYRNGIQVVSYVPPTSSFSSGFTQCPDFLPTDDSLKSYAAFLRVSLSGDTTSTLDFCYGLYDLVYRWSTFVHLSAPITTPPFGATPNFVDITSTLTGKPSSWYTTQCLVTSITAAPFGVTLNTLTSALSGPYPKKWRAEASTNLSAERTPNRSTGGPLTWSLSTPSWSVETQISSNNIDYVYELQYSKDGLNPYTASVNNNTPIYLQANQIVSTVISAEPFDWQTKQYVFSDSKNCSIYARGDFKVYTSNRYVLTGTQVEFQNISVGFNGVEKIEVDLNDNNQAVTLSGSSLYSNITAAYTELGYKTITGTVVYSSTLTPQPANAISTFTDIIKVVAEYDTIDTENYRTPKTPLQLPWPEVPKVAPNEWVNEDNINSVFTKFYENLEYLEIRGRGYETRPAEFFGWLGTPPLLGTTCPIYTWDSLDCLVQDNSNTVTWEDVQNVTPEFPSITTTGRLSSCCSWDDYICTPQEQNPEKIGKYCISWKWSARTSANSRTAVTWSSTKSNRSYNKKWVFEPCVTQDGSILIGSACEEGIWNVNIEKINTYYDPIANCTVNSSCAYKDIVSKNNILYVALTNEVKVLSSDYSGTFVASRLLLDDLFAFRDIRGIALDSQNKLFVLDGTLNRVASYNINLTDPVPFDLFLSWGGFGTSKSTQGFSKPNDICIDNFDNVWIADTGNKCVKGYSNTGTWLITIIDSSLRTTPPISITTDSENNLHCLTQTGVRVYNQQGTFIFEYSFTDTVSEEAQPIKINSNYNKEIIYIVFSNTVARYFKNGVYAGRLIDNKTCATNIQDVYQDEFRNTLVVSGDKILKYIDLMELKSIKGPLPGSYWPLSNLYIHKDEYVQNWVYNKSFQRLWDNIELFRGSLIFDETRCKSYKPPTYSKEQIIIGQNEIVTSAVVNRSIEYLWSNFESLLSYFDPNCS